MGRAETFFSASQHLRYLLPTSSYAFTMELQAGKYPLCFKLTGWFIYFDDAEGSKAPVSLNNQTWESVKSYSKSVREFFVVSIYYIGDSD
jgi:hypothetical protein